MHTIPNTPNSHLIRTTETGVHIGGAYFPQNRPKLSSFEEDLQNALLNYKVSQKREILREFINSLWKALS